jgi:hypothetical protein
MQAREVVPAEGEETGAVGEVVLAEAGKAKVVKAAAMRMVDEEAPEEDTTIQEAEHRNNSSAHIHRRKQTPRRMDHMLPT